MGLAVSIRIRPTYTGYLPAVKSGMGADVASSDLERAIATLGELDGRRVSEAIVAEIFSHFCVGK